MEQGRALEQHCLDARSVEEPQRLVQALLLELVAGPGLPVHPFETAEIRILDPVLAQVQVRERQQAEAGELDVVKIDAAPPLRPVSRHVVAAAECGLKEQLLFRRGEPAAHSADPLRRRSSASFTIRV